MSKNTNYTSIFDTPATSPGRKPLKNKKATALIAAVLIVCVLGAAAFAAVKFSPKKPELTDEGSAVLTVAEDTVTEVTTSFEGDSITLKKDGDKWLYGEQDVTENSAVKTLIGRCSSVIALKTMPSNKSDYGFSEPHGKVKFKAGGKSYTITFGNTINDGYAHYFKLSGDDNVYLMLQTIVGEYNTSANALKEETTQTETDLKHASVTD